MISRFNFNKLYIIYLAILHIRYGNLAIISDRSLVDCGSIDGCLLVRVAYTCVFRGVVGLDLKASWQYVDPGQWFLFLLTTTQQERQRAGTRITLHEL